MDHKYKTDKPNVLWAKSGIGSPFWNGLTWAFSAARPFFRWVLGNVHHISFSHDVWVGECSLKTQFFDVFDICQ